VNRTISYNRLLTSRGRFVQVAQLGTPLLAPAIRRCLKVISDESNPTPASRYDGIGSGGCASGGYNYYIIVVLTAGVVADFRECVNVSFIALLLFQAWQYLCSAEFTINLVRTFALSSFAF
jgi:hypothetical protein